MRTVAEISDPVHGYFYLSGVEKDIVDSPIFQRLRRIRQLASAYLTYPSAQHTRFEHSLGAMHLAGHAGNVLKEKGYVSDEDTVQMLRLAALLHDIGHGPFSHLFEEVLEVKGSVTHEDIGRRMIRESAISDTLARHGYGAGEVSDLAFGQSSSRFLNEIISGGLSVDLMDYLQRDAYFTGAHYGRIDAERIISSLEVYDNRLAIDRAALNSFESLLIARYQMFKAVYFHKTVRAAEVMLLKAMMLADEQLQLSESCKRLEDYMQLTDDTTLIRILSLDSDKRELVLARRLAEDYRDRRLFKPVFESILQASSRLINRLTDARYLRDRCAEIAGMAGVDPDMVYIDSAKAPSIPRAPTKEEPRDLILVGKEPFGVKVIAMKDIPLISSIMGYMNMIRVYTIEGHREKVARAALSVFGSEAESWYERIAV
ncbi:MAG: HD domain-containing protein [Candidatus Nitrosocaldus sp.]|nr:HD domain-containing protein [Candidatus Nitrosocaldus sp.]MDW8274827.1 HD domain-containing protein [Candidatus Nitrosocaldus sp.]